MLSLEVTEFVHDPFPIGIIDNAFLDFDKMEFPDTKNFFHYRDEFAIDYANRHFLWALHPQFKDIIKNSTWLPFFKWLRSPAFEDYCKKLVGQFGYEVSGKGSMIQFSSVPADGGWLKRHSDHESKVLVFVLFFSGYEQPFTALKGDEKIHFPMKPNRCLFFIKNDWSWHCVEECKGKGQPDRLTVNFSLTKEPKFPDFSKHRNPGFEEKYPVQKYSDYDDL